MPAVHLRTNVSIKEAVGAGLLEDLSRIVADTIGKPEKYVMASADEVSMIMSGESSPAAFVELGSIGGLSGDIPGKLTALICDFLKAELNIPPDRVYIRMDDVPAGKWGWNGSTFG